MKKILQSFLLLMLCISAQAGNVLIGGRSYNVDTTAMFKAGPGVQYMALEFRGSRRMNAFFLKVDLTNPYITYRAAISNDSIYGGEQPTRVAARKSREGAVYIAGTNGDFYHTSGYVGLPTGYTMVDHEIADIPLESWHKMVMAIDDAKTPYVGAMDYRGTLRIGSDSYSIAHVNHLREAGQLVLYNQHNGHYTHTGDDGTEVLVKLAEGQTWGVNKVLEAKVEKVAKGKGNMQIPAGCAVLSGNGAVADALGALSVGSTVKITLNLTLEGNAKSFSEVIGGDIRSLIIKGGVVSTADVWDELHPRTGFGYTADRKTAIHCVVDGRSTISTGATTKDLAEIMKFVGAYDAINLDGGGSSCLFLKDFGPMNKNSDGQERAVSNGIYVVSTAPTDNNISEIRCVKERIRLPRYGVYTPLFYGYNQYGVLVSKNVQGVTQTVDPSVGKILDDGSFLASGTKSGEITATYNGATTKITVEQLAESTISIRLDSVLLDNRTGYPIEVQTEVEGNLMGLYPGALTWEVDNPAVCSVTDGVLHGLRNGTAVVTGSLGAYKDQIKVKVEVAEYSPMAVRPFTDASWKVTTSNNLKNVVNAPTEQSVKTSFTYKSGRNSNVAYNNDVALYSLPDSIKLTFNPGEVNVRKLSMRFKENNGGIQTINKEFSGFEKNKDYTISLALADLMDHPSDRRAYPLYFNFMQFAIGSAGMTASKSYSVEIKQFALIYKNVSTGIVNTTAGHGGKAVVSMAGGKGAQVVLNLDREENVRVEVASVAGNVVRQSYLGRLKNGTYTLPLSGLPAGLYVVTVYHGKQHSTVKALLN